MCVHMCVCCAEELASKQMTKAKDNSETPEPYAYRSTAHG